MTASQRSEQAAGNEGDPTALLQWHRTPPPPPLLPPLAPMDAVGQVEGEAGPWNRCGRRKGKEEHPLSLAVTARSCLGGRWLRGGHGTGHAQPSHRSVLV